MATSWGTATLNLTARHVKEKPPTRAQSMWELLQNWLQWAKLFFRAKGDTFDRLTRLKTDKITDLQIHIRKMSDAQVRWTFFFFLLRIQVFWGKKRKRRDHLSLTWTRFLNAHHYKPTQKRMRWQQWQNTTLKKTKQTTTIQPRRKDTRREEQVEWWKKKWQTHQREDNGPN